MALSMKPACERCDRVLGQIAEAYICSYECTYCPDCCNEMQYRCPNCSGELVRRPTRSPGSAAEQDSG